MPGSPHESNERNVPRDRLAGVTVESDFDYSWLSKEPPGYEDVADDGKVIEQGGDAASSHGQ